MKGRSACVWASSLVVLPLMAAPLAAQTAPAPLDWSHGTTLALSGGVASGASDLRGVFGASVGWEITPRVVVEGGGSWFNRQDESDAFSAALTVQGHLVPPRPLSPFVEGGFGMYRASFDRSASAIPDFYRDRMAAGGINVTNTFTDPAYVVGAGVNVFATRHLALRPMVETLIVIRDGDTYSVTTFALRAAYHFEEHPRSPSRKK